VEAKIEKTRVAKAARRGETRREEKRKEEEKDKRK